MVMLQEDMLCVYLSSNLTIAFLGWKNPHSVNIVPLSFITH